MGLLLRVILLSLLAFPAWAYDYCADVTTVGCYLMDDAFFQNDSSGANNDLDYAPAYTTARRASSGRRFPFITDQVPSGYEGYSQKFRLENTLIDTATTAASQNINGADAAITMAAWVYFNGTMSATVNPVIIGKHREVDGGHQYSLQIDGKSSSAFSFQFIISSDGTNDVVAETTLTNYAKSTWYHVAAVSNDTDMRIYVNGLLANTPTAHTAGIFNSSTARFGLGNYSGARSNTTQFVGYMDEVFLSNAALSALDVSALYEEGVDGENGGNDSNIFTVYDADAEGSYLSFEDLWSEIDTILSANPTWSKEIIGYSKGALAIYGVVIPNTSPLAQVIGVDSVTHGYEKTPSLGVLSFLRYKSANPSIMADAKFVIIPVINVDGYVAETRYNLNRVDMNRNYTAGFNSGYGSRDPTNYSGFQGYSPLSESETQAVAYFYRKYKPNKVITGHTSAQTMLWPTTWNKDTIDSINTYITGNGFSGFDVSTSSAHPNGTENSWLYDNGAESYTLELAESLEPYTNKYEANRFVSAIIGLYEASVRKSWENREANFFRIMQ